MISAKTVIADNPLLDVRLWQGRNPIKIIIDRLGILQNHLNLKVLNSEEPTYIFTTSTMTLNPSCQAIKIGSDGSFMSQVFKELIQMGITSCFVEGGSTLHQVLIQENLWDEMRVFTAPVELEDGIKAPAFPHLSSTITSIDINTLTSFRNK